MEPQFLSIEAFNELINQWNGKNIIIKKIEMDDVDMIRVELDHISYSEEPEGMDGYVSKYALLLNGYGETLTADDFQSLPNMTYEIPLEDTSLYEYNGNTFIITTDRGVYQISLSGAGPL
ncbi:hypothetical protein JNUCC1_03025 [Lentibacillus sp. JNUCC-1]|uniref:hypothetical protein n=1 Tax=Lentibacillus sp. JNUCC-1 TaxID=2654513 RepID=UPI0012E847B5|nr:hypothetical protein [Lentibacillus sp. JNUCC-1]MUV39152.1 hypothetical protein [Lentibacillus sp. JNUCC-1]